MFYNLKNNLKRALFDQRCKDILHTRPVCFSEKSGAILLSQLQHKDIVMYLLAVKSFISYVEIANVYILNDGTLTIEDIDLLKRHLPGCVILKLRDYQNKHCPKGGTWERLLAISEFVKDSYVIQLDSDTLAIKEIDEVVNCCRSETAFTIGTWDGQTIESMEANQQRAKPLAKPHEDAHVQVLSEANFDALRDFQTLKYVRGCSGFAGFPKNSFNRSFIEEISAGMRDAIGVKWDAWGSEQLMSNIVVANIKKTSVLPHPKYCNCNRISADVTAFIHFIGDCRFNGGKYAAMGKNFIGVSP